MSKFYNWAKGKTTTEDLNRAINNKADVISQILEEMSTDGECESAALLTNYIMATEEERAIMDTVLVNLCGWTMSSIIDKAIEDANYYE